MEEARGREPVVISKVPELATFALLDLPVAIALIAKRKQFTRRL